MSNPVAAFAADNNGVSLQLQAIGNGGAPTATGTLIFGVGTQSNNTPGTGAVVLTAATSGSITTVYKGQACPKSVIDSGSNGFYFTDSSIPQCGSSGPAPGAFYCPTSTLSCAAAANTDNNEDGTTGSGPSSTVNFMIGNANTVIGTDPKPTAADDIGGTLNNTALDNSFLFGLPFFYGRTVYIAFEGSSTAQGPGPYYAY